jgi:hypothetical protein
VAGGVTAIPPRSITDKLALFRACFSGVTRVYGTYDPRTGRSWQVKQPVTDGVLRDHIEGCRPYGVYLLVGDYIRALAVDFDAEDLGPPIEFINAAGHYRITAYLERSKAKGYHAWIFFNAGGVLARQARLVARHVLAEIGHPHTEVFPKQDKLIPPDFYGNFINAPLFGRLLPAGRSAFLDPRRGWRPYVYQWALLQTVQRISTSRLDEIIELNDLQSPKLDASTASPPGRVTSRSFGLPPCAQRMLNEGVSENQRVACFRLAVSLKKAGIPQDLAVPTLLAWAEKNRPTGGKRVITPEEIIEQTRCAYAGSYRGCGCEDPAITPYCDNGCPLCVPVRRPR